MSVGTTRLTPGFEPALDVYADVSPFRDVTNVPLWSMVLPVAFPTVWTWYRDRRRALGLCSTCGYDLRGADHAVCPECGAAIANWKDA